MKDPTNWNQGSRQIVKRPYENIVSSFFPPPATLLATRCLRKLSTKTFRRSTVAHQSSPCGSCSASFVEFVASPSCRGRGLPREFWSVIFQILPRHLSQELILQFASEETISTPFLNIFQLFFHLLASRYDNDGGWEIKHLPSFLFVLSQKGEERFCFGEGIVLCAAKLLTPPRLTRIRSVLEVCYHPFPHSAALLLSHAARWGWN